MKQKGRACLDAFAWLTWLQDEPGAAAVQHWLDEAEAARAECVTSVINLGEAYYRLVRVDRRDQAESLWRMALRGTLPVSVKDATRRRVRRAAEIKSKHALAYADAFAVKRLEGEQSLEVQWLPRRRSHSANSSHQTRP